MTHRNRWSNIAFRGEDIVRIVLALDHLETSVLRTVDLSDPSILFFRKNIDVRAGTEHVRSQCLEEGTWLTAISRSRSSTSQDGSKSIERRLPDFSVDMLICPLIIGHASDTKIPGRLRWTDWLGAQTLDELASGRFRT